MSRTTRLSRREFAALVAAGAGAAATATSALAGSRPKQGGLTVARVIDRMRERVGVPWTTETADTLKAGDPAMVVTGIVTTALPTMTVLREAAQSGANLVVTAGPAFYSRADSRTPPAGRGGGPGRGGPPPAARPDPVFDAKNALVDGSPLAIVRFSDHWRQRRPDPFAAGLATALGWTPGTADDDPMRCAFEPVTLGALAGDVKRRLGARGGIRVIGDPDLQLSTAALLPGSTPIAASVAVLPSVDVIVAGEVREWESTEYVRDAIHAGRGKALILVGRIVSEEPGMQVLADWLAPIVDRIPVRHVAAGDPYWRPA